MTIKYNMINHAQSATASLLQRHRLLRISIGIVLDDSHLPKRGLSIPVLHCKVGRRRKVLLDELEGVELHNDIIAHEHHRVRMVLTKRGEAEGHLASTARLHSAH